MIVLCNGNLLNDDADALVNPVNCDGIVPGGLARQFAMKWPEILGPYAADCSSGVLRIGTCTVNQTDAGRTIVQFPTMPHPGMSAKLQDISVGLDSLRTLIETERWNSVAIPALGCGVGGLAWDEVFSLFEHRLGDLECDIRVYPPPDR